MPNRKNVLLIIADQFRWDCLGAAGNPIIKTPHLDALAAEGVLFKKAFCQTAPCGPSRMSIFTGRYLCSTRTVNNMTPLVDAEDNLAWFVKRAGYATGMFGYNDYAIDPRILPDGDPRKTSLRYDNALPGFDHVYQHEYHSPAYFEYLRAKGYPEDLCGPAICSTYNVPPGGPGEHLPLRYPAHYRAEDSESQFLTTQVCDWMRAKGSGWFANVNFIKPHPPRICPAPYHDMYDPAGMPAPNRRKAELNTAHPYLRAVHTCPSLMDERDLRQTRACYYGMISEIDACVGRFIATLKETGQWGNTLIIFTSDHGEYLGDHFLLDKAHFYDETMRVPFILRDPSRKADGERGAVFDRFAESVDAAPTIQEFRGEAMPDRFQGESLLGQVRGNTGACKTEVHFEYDFRQRYAHVANVCPDECILWVLRDDHWKYVQFGVEEMPPLLFNLLEDPGEHENLADRPSHASIAAEYARKMLRWRMKHEDQRMEHWAARYR
ncbi:MAG: sulfatase-like hydrolase/transferase [Candidatus Hydrogenedentes bacterium]|nr:sulfatase-like hydrolase/transferase [Candidatus Hydrogenedentota bacterium]